jgi:hypothetical protein
MAAFVADRLVYFLVTNSAPDPISTDREPCSALKIQKSFLPRRLTFSEGTGK